jgi:hypothetical protein
MGRLQWQAVVPAPYQGLVACRAGLPWTMLSTLAHSVNNEAARGCMQQQLPLARRAMARMVEAWPAEVTDAGQHDHGRAYKVRGSAFLAVAIDSGV